MGGIDIYTIYNMLIYHDTPTLYSNLQCGGRRYVTGSCGFKFLMINSEWEDPSIAATAFLTTTSIQILGEL